MFAEWNERFLAERRAKKEAEALALQQNVDPEKASRLTGKQIFLEFQNINALALAEAARLGQSTEAGSQAASAAENVFLVDEALYADVVDEEDDEEADDEEAQAAFAAAEDEEHKS